MLKGGDRFGDYRIEAQIGRGGMGIVYRATHLVIDRTVALKLMLSELADDDRFRERFIRESRIAASIEHPNVIAIYDAGERDGQLFIAMRYVPGTDLDRILRAQPDGLGVQRAVRFVQQTAAALDAAHEAGGVHRDVKPANILVSGTDDEHVYLTDFGLTRLVEGQTNLTATGGFVGTVDYCAPEQIEGTRVGPTADVYALGCVLFHALTGRPPFQADAAVAVLYAHVHTPAPAPSSLAADLPPALDAVLARALAKAPEDRYATAGELAAAAAQASAPAVSMGAPTVTAAAKPGATGPSTTSAAEPESLEQGPTQAASTVDRPGTPSAVLPDQAEHVRVAGGGPSTLRRRAAAAAAACALAVVVVVLIVLPGAGGGADRPPTVTATIGVGAQPGALGVIGHRVYVLNVGDATLSTIDAETSKIEGAPIALDGRPGSIAVDAGHIWTASPSDGRLRRIDPNPAGGSRSRSWQVGEQLVSASAHGSSIWTLCRTNKRLFSFSVKEPIRVTVKGETNGVYPTAVLASASGVWITAASSRTVLRADPDDLRPDAADFIRPINYTSIAVGRGPRGMVEYGGKLWVAVNGDDRVERIDVHTLKVVGAPIRVGDGPQAIAAGLGAIWVANYDDDTVTRIDPATGRVSGSPIQVGKGPLAIAVADGAVWVTNAGHNTVTRIAASPLTAA